VEFNRNFGHQAALSAGLDTAQGDVVITMAIPLVGGFLMVTLGIVGYLRRVHLPGGQAPAHVRGQADARRPPAPVAPGDGTS